MEILLEHAGFIVGFAFTLYSAAIYNLVNVLKKATKNIEIVAKYRFAMAALIGGITGPFVYPTLFMALEYEHELPLYFSVLLGVGTGSVAENVYHYSKSKLKRE